MTTTTDTDRLRIAQAQLRTLGPRLNALESAVVAIRAMCAATGAHFPYVQVDAVRAALKEVDYMEFTAVEPPLLETAITPDPECSICGGTGVVNGIYDPDTDGWDVTDCRCMAGPVKP